MTYFLGIDTSCDDTSAAVICDHSILANIVSSQISLHQPYGGVFPTIAKLAHQQNIDPVVNAALQKSHLTPNKLNGIAVTVGPGLAPALEVGINYALNFATIHSLPIFGVNHLEGHLLSPLLTARTALEHNYQLAPAHPAKILFNQPQLPFLGLIVSGGHSEFVELNCLGNYQLLGETLDDAAGECLDKIGRMLNLGYPAAPVLEKLARSGNPRFPFPLPLTSRHDYDLSFSGLKTFARNLIASLEKDGPLDSQTLNDLCASAQVGIFKHLLYKLDKLLASHPPFGGMLLGGGVAANIYFRNQLLKLASKHNLPVFLPYSRKLCGDNAAMIALAGCGHFCSGATTSFLNLDRQPNLELASWCSTCS